MNSIRYTDSDTCVHNARKSVMTLFPMKSRLCGNPECDNPVQSKYSHRPKIYCCPRCRIRAWHLKEEERKTKEQSLKESRRREEAKKFIEEYSTFWSMLKENALAEKRANLLKPISFEWVLQETKRLSGIGVNNNLRRFLRELLEEAESELKDVFRKQ